MVPYTRYAKNIINIMNFFLFVTDKMEERENDAGLGVPDMTMMPQITEQAINDNLKKRYIHDLVYVSFMK